MLTQGRPERFFVRCRGAFVSQAGGGADLSQQHKLVFQEWLRELLHSLFQSICGLTLPMVSDSFFGGSTPRLHSPRAQEVEFMVCSLCFSH